MPAVSFYRVAPGECMGSPDFSAALKRRGGAGGWIVYTDGEGRRTEEEEDEDGPAAFICSRQTTSSLSQSSHRPSKRKRNMECALRIAVFPRKCPNALQQRCITVDWPWDPPPPTPFIICPISSLRKEGREREAARKPLSFSPLPVWFDPCMAKGGTEGVEKRGWVVVGPPQDERIILVYKVCLLLC